MTIDFNIWHGGSSRHYLHCSCPSASAETSYYMLYKMSHPMRSVGGVLNSLTKALSHMTSAMPDLWLLLSQWFGRYQNIPLDDVRVNNSVSQLTFLLTDIFQVNWG